ncbi:MAG: hypothetical protein HYV27_10515 [Candidatus Hydrogenedentes bacterium]|nr:hypothetical protein [Candidatus Hydrogenedentota bacterium]
MTKASHTFQDPPDPAGTTRENAAFRLGLDEFHAAGTECTYRTQALAGEKQQARVFILLLLPVIFAFVINDFLMRDSPAPLRYLFVLRVCEVIIFLTGLILIPRLQNTLQFDRTLTLIAFTFVVMAFLIDLGRPPEYMGHFLVDTFILFIVYSGLPVPLRLQLLVTLPYTVALILLFWFHKLPPSGPYHISFFSTILLTTLAGCWLATRSGRQKRLKHLALDREEHARMQLQHALEDIRTLSGMLPICANCKKVRQDDGYWQQIETYVSKHTSIDFSHCVCPECLKMLCPDLAPTQSEDP